ncbi:EAL domain-containing protein [Halanaerobiaceae bacterium Z-7014]|uniref:EAL domain-containing protein n=1 Tax=Halonatronomonas betaini TaxID=2778430 RepID=A0A931AWB5_9FIRM|nr:GGDEF domain-containing phosphodiesterase [Halonatronomonas betaini]MBF8437874.1 EAL domain-containing protein [Halonatronomonas betaini]
MLVKDLSFYTHWLVTKWRDPGRKTKTYSLAIIILIFLISAGGIYLIGRYYSDSYIYMHSMHLPIILSAIIFRSKGGVIAGFIAGMIFAPIIPIDFGLDLLRARVGWLLRTSFFMAEGMIAGVTFEILHYQFNKLEESSYHDPSSGLPNKLFLFNKLKEIQQEDEITDYKLVLINIKNYSEAINNFGHGKTVEFNQAIAGKIKGNFNQVNNVYNIYNENFVVIYNEDSHNNSLIDLIKLLENEFNQSFEFNDLPVYLETYFSVTSIENKLNPEELFQNVYLALKEARDSNQTLIEYKNDYREKEENNLILLGEIKDSIQNDDFFLKYLPKLDLKNNEIIGAEALIRWNHPEKGQISPGLFIPQVEKTALINDLTYWVVKKSCQELNQLKEAGIDINISINITPRNLLDNNFIDNLFKIISNHDLRPADFDLELTETDIMQDIDTAAIKLSELSQAGFNISLDDFGTGYSSLSYLKELPFNSLKVDQIFIKDIYQKPKSKEIVSAAIKLGHIIGCQVVAEGVETEQTITELNSLKCDYIQGFYITEPLVIADFIDWHHNY